jgi:hypothetical protein
MNKISLTVLTLLIMIFVSSSYAMESDSPNPRNPTSMKMGYLDLFKISFSTNHCTVRPFVLDDFTQDTIDHVFTYDRKRNSTITKESLGALFKDLKEPCLGVFEKTTGKCIGTTRLSVGMHFEHSFESSIRLVDVAKTHVNEVRIGINQHLKTVVSRHKKWNIHCLEIIFASAADATGAEAAELIRYDSMQRDAPTLKMGAALPASNVLCYYSLRDDSPAANSAQSDTPTRSWWSCFACC